MLLTLFEFQFETCPSEMVVAINLVVCFRKVASGGMTNENVWEAAKSFEERYKINSWVVYYDVSLHQIISNDFHHERTYL